MKYGARIARAAGALHRTRTPRRNTVSKFAGNCPGEKAVSRAARVTADAALTHRPLPSLLDELDPIT